MIEADWYNCYGKMWTGIITPESFAHPAKFSRALIQRIYAHALEQGYISTGAVIVDPFGGVALGALHAMQNGLHWVGVELEEKFVILGRGMDCSGIDAAFYRRYQQRGKKGLKLGICPECGNTLDEYIPFDHFFGTITREIPQGPAHHYAGNIETWEEKYNFPGTAMLLQGDSRRLCDVVGKAGVVAGSPPYSARTVHSQSGIDTEKMSEGRNTPGKNAQAFVMDDYGDTPGQLGAMQPGSHAAAIGSPPYIDGCAHTGGDDLNPEHIEGGIFHGVGIAGAFSSPPYSGNDKADNTIADRDKDSRGSGSFRGTYGRSDGQLAAMKSGDPLASEPASKPTFWSAAREIMQQCYQIIPPGGVAIWVVKSFVRDKKIIDFPDQWRQLGEACGFESIEWIRAWLVEDRGAQFDLDGGLNHKTVERKSFFRRLAEKKGSPPIDFEVVLIQRKPDHET